MSISHQTVIRDQEAAIQADQRSTRPNDGGSQHRDRLLR